MMLVSGRKVALLLKLYRKLAGISQVRLAHLMSIMFEEKIDGATISKFENNQGLSQSDIKEFSMKVMAWLNIMGINSFALVAIENIQEIAGNFKYRRTIRDLKTEEKIVLNLFHRMSPKFSIENLQILELIFGVTPEDLHRWFVHRSYTGKRCLKRKRSKDSGQKDKTIEASREKVKSYLCHDAFFESACFDEEIEDDVSWSQIQQNVTSLISNLESKEYCAIIDEDIVGMTKHAIQKIEPMSFQSEEKTYASLCSVQSKERKVMYEGILGRLRNITDIVSDVVQDLETCEWAT